MSTMNIPYALGRHSNVPSCALSSIWKVQADDSYCVNKRSGFSEPGLFITYEGQGSIAVAGECYQLTASTFFLLPEQTPTIYNCVRGDWKFYFLNFSSLDMCRLLGLPIGRMSATSQITEAMRLCAQLIDTLIEQPIGFAYSANHRLHEILLLFAGEQPAAAAARHIELNAVLLHIHRNIDQPISTQKLVQLSGMSRSSFYARFRSVTGFTPGDYMLKLKLESAKASLETTSLPLKEISSKLHFYDEFHFSKLFKRKYGVSPSEYRRLRTAGQQQPSETDADLSEPAPDSK
jgi:AraC-like DNA-binding protein